MALLLQAPVFSHLRSRAWDVWVSKVAHLFRIGMLSVPGDVQEQLQTLRAENVRLQAEATDCRQVRQQLGSPAFADFLALPAEVMGRPLDTFHSRLVLSRGTRDGVTIGAPVVVYGSVLVGFITEVNERSAVLQLLVHPDTTLAAESVDVERSGRGLVQGRSFTAVALTTVPRDIPLREGQAVVSQARAEVMPYGLLIGYVHTIEHQEYEPYQQARLLLPYRLDELKAMTILVSP